MQQLSAIGAAQEQACLARGLDAMERDELIKKMRARVEQCRRLAQAINNPAARKTLLEMADEGEVDIRKLEQEASNSS